MQHVAWLHHSTAAISGWHAQRSTLCCCLLACSLACCSRIDACLFFSDQSSRGHLGTILGPGAVLLGVRTHVHICGHTHTYLQCARFDMSSLSCFGSSPIHLHIHVLTPSLTAAALAAVSGGVGSRSGIRRQQAAAAGTAAAVAAAAAAVAASAANSSSSCVWRLGLLSFQGGSQSQARSGCAPDDA